MKKANQVLAALGEFNSAALSMMAEEEIQKNDIRKWCSQIRLREARASLGDISVEELKNSRAGIRVAALQSAGYRDLGALSEASDRKIMMIDGIGESQLHALRGILTQFTANLARHKTIRISDREEGREEDALLLSLMNYRKTRVIRKDAAALSEELHILTQDVISRAVIRSSFRWIFSGREKKEQTLSAISDAMAYFDSPSYERLSSLIGKRAEISSETLEDARIDFRKNSAEYYAIIEQVGGSGISEELLYSSIPARLAAGIEAYELNTEDFNGTLRSYQAFGAKYILTQKRVLLGDEMGLGKTVQAIAAMCDLESRFPKSHYLVVCPASVLINWCREIKKFCSVTPFLIHGPKSEYSLSCWKEEGGAAVTNYENMGRIVLAVDEKMPLRMLVIDEAHYIKNPDAMRTRLIRRLDNESEHILMMTGTPLENRVEEMCSLIDFIRPDMTEDVRKSAYMRLAPEFREMIAPFYLRRTRADVLQELPPVEEQQEWCSMTVSDRISYLAAVGQRNFASMRRVSFLQERLNDSSKALRLQEIAEEALSEGRKMIIYSFFRETVRKVSELFGNRVIGIISGYTAISERQELIDRFTEAPDGSILVCQVQAGGTGLNIQAASIAVFCEPQIKPSLTTQAIARIYRMGQIRNVLIYHLLCEDTVDEAMVQMLERKQHEFDTYADESVMGDALGDLVDSEWIRQFIEEERQKYLPAVIT